MTSEVEESPDIAYLGNAYIDQLQSVIRRDGRTLELYESDSIDTLRSSVSGSTCSCEWLISEYPLDGVDLVQFLESIREEADIPITILIDQAENEETDRLSSYEDVRVLSIDDNGASIAEISGKLSTFMANELPYSSGQSPTRIDRHLIDQNIAGVYELKGSSFAYVNARFAEIFGYEPDELVGMSAFEVVAERDHSTVETQMELLDQEEVEDIETELTGVRKDGEEIEIVAHGKFVEDGADAPHYLGFIQEITDQKERQRRFEAVFNNTYQFTGLMEPDGTLIEANETALSFGDLELDDVVGEKLWDTYWVQSGPDARQAVRDAVEAASDGEFYRDEITVQGADRDLIIDFSVRPITDEQGDVSLLIPEGRDISELKQRERQRETIIRRVTDAIVEIDEDWRFTLVDERAQEIYEIPESELLGEHFWDVFEWGQGTIFEEKYQQVMDTRESTSFVAFYDGADSFSGLVGWFEIHVYPESDGGLSFYFRDVSERKRREERNRGLNDLLSGLMEAASVEEACRLVTTAADDLHIPILELVVFDEERGELHRTTRSPEARRDLDSRSLLDQDSGLCWDAFIEGSPQTIEDPSAEILDTKREIDHLSIRPLGRHGLVIAAIRDEDAEFLATVTENVRSSLDRIQSETKLQEREERLEEQNESLNRLNRINKVIRSIDRVLVGASTRSEIEQAVCEELTTDNTYSFAWFGKYDSAGGRMVPRESAGEDNSYFDAVSFAVDSSPDEIPVATAGRTGEPQIINDVLSDPPFESWREAALRRGFRATIAIPILYDDTRYGVLGLYSDSADVFDETEEDVLTELSENIGHALNAVESKQTLLSDQIVELEIAMGATDHRIVQYIQEDPERQFELRGVVLTPDEEIRIFFATRNVSADGFAEFLNTTTEIREFEVMTEHDEERLYQAIVSESSLTYWLIDRGAVLRRFRIENAESRIMVELGRQSELRAFVDQLTQEYPDTNIVASRQREKPIRSRTDFMAMIEDNLTNRQREALKTAYFNGFFETPRERNATEIAASLDVSQPTFSTHLRTGFRNLMELLFEYDDSSLED